MQFAGKDGKTVVLIGAGATRGAYLGIGRRKIHPPLNADFFKVARKFVQTREGQRYAGAFKRLDAFVQKEMLLRATESFTMEEIFNVLFISKDLPAVFTQGGRHRKVGHRREIEDFFRLVVGVLRFIQGNPRPPRNIDHYAVLAQLLQPEDTVVSLNYDTLMDNALRKVGWDARVGYGFDARPKIKKGEVSGPFPLEDVLLLKPHGSLNWSAKGSLKNYEKVLSRRPPSSIRLADVPAAYENAKKKLIRFFIPPLYSKFFANRFWSGLWDTAFVRLRNADDLLVIGCSLIGTDFHLRAIIGRALSKRARKFERIVLVDRSPTVIKKLKSFMRGKSARGFETYSSFTDFILAYRP